MKKIAAIFACTSILFFGSCEELANGLTNDEIVQGLKEALDVGLENSVSIASTTDGYLKNEIVKILLPPEVKALQDEVETGSISLLSGTINIPYKTIMDAYVALDPNVETDMFTELTVAMNRGAEAASVKAKPIFKDAIVNMSFTDALGILQGAETSATDYFYTDTNEALYNAFQPDVKSALDQTKANAIYESALGFLNYQYKVNSLLTIKVSDYINLELPATIDGYATEKAIDGLFYYIGEEEKKIRADPYAWGNTLIEKVFGSPEAQVGR